LEEDTHAEARLRQELQVHRRPRQPGCEAAHFNFAGLQHRKTLTDDSHVSFIKVMKWTWYRSSKETPMNQLSCISPLLDCNLRYTGEWLAVLV
jgi:hypothetical protein